MSRDVDKIVNGIMDGSCILILDGKKFGTLLGELLKKLKTAEIELDKRTPEGLKKKIESIIDNPAGYQNDTISEIVKTLEEDGE